MRVRNPMHPAFGRVASDSFFDDLLELLMDNLFEFNTNDIFSSPNWRDYMALQVLIIFCFRLMFSCKIVTISELQCFINNKDRDR